MEQADNLSVVPYDAGWSDFEDWDAVWSHRQPDKQGMALSSAATALDCRNSLLRSESNGLKIIGLVPDNIVVVAMNVTALIAERSRTQDVKQVVEGIATRRHGPGRNLPQGSSPIGAGTKACSSAGAFRSSASLCCPALRSVFKAISTGRNGELSWREQQELRWTATYRC